MNHPPDLPSDRDHPGRILVVDDQDVIRMLLSRELVSRGHQVQSAATGQDALAQLRADPVDLVLLDIMMPDMSGIEVLGLLQADPQLRETPVIMLSADTDIERVVACIRGGADDYIFKPYNAVLLVARVAASLERKRLRDRERSYRASLEQVVAERTALAEQRAAALEHSETALRLSEERYALAALGANDGLWDWDLRAGTIYLSARWKAMLGYEAHEIGDGPEEWLGRIHPDDRELFEVRLAAHFRQLITHLQHEYRIQHRDGTYRWVLSRGLAVWDASGQALRIAGSQTDVSDRKAAEQQLLHDALHDVLTGLPNRVLFADRLDRTMAMSRRQPDHLFAVLFLDLDRFKTINDSLGHAVGDQLLIAIAVRLTESLRPGDTVARMGGDEFTVLLEQIESEEVAEQIAERIEAAISVPLQLGEHAVFTTASIGITYSSHGYTRPADMVRDADTAMYHAKLRGKACHVRFDPAMHAAAMAKLEIEQDLRGALGRGELRLHYQPIVSLTSGAITGFEALIRWDHPQRGLLFPGTFLEIAEETGMMVPITWWVLREACRQMKIWQEQIPSLAGLAVNVNLSARIFSQVDMLDQLAAVLAETGLPPASLKLEITEHTFIEFGSLTSEILSGIRAQGVQLCIDDFGTGYSSLSYLHTFPVNVLKIDRSFIDRLGTQTGQGDIVQTIINLARTLGMDVVAEGIETAEQAEQLKRFECAHGQGWLFAPAMAESEIRSLISGDRG